MGTLNRAQLLEAASAARLPRTTLHIAELGGDVIVRGLTGRERDEFERSLLKGRGKAQRVDTDNVRAKLAVKCCINEDGSRMFEDADAEALGNLRADVLALIYDAAQALNGLRDEDVEELKNASGSEAGSASPTS